MQTGRGDAAQRAKTRVRIPVAVDASDASCGFCVGPDFERFSQVDDVFSRSRYDPDVHTDKAETFYATYRRPLADWRAAKGYQQNDYAFCNATWHAADVFAEMYEIEDLVQVDLGGGKDGRLHPPELA